MSCYVMFPRERGLTLYEWTVASLQTGELQPEVGRDPPSVPTVPPV